MNRLSIEDFIFISDYELSQYKILNALTQYKEDFRNNRIFPGLSELAEIMTKLKQIDKKKAKLVDMFPIPIRKIDADKRRLIFDNFWLNNHNIEDIFDLVKWAIPVIGEVMDEGLNSRKLDSVEGMEIAIQ